MSLAGVESPLRVRPLPEKAELEELACFRSILSTALKVRKCSGQEQPGLTPYFWSAPFTWSTFVVPLRKTNVGLYYSEKALEVNIEGIHIADIEYRAATSRAASTSHLRKLTLMYFLESASNAGAIIWQGPHLKYISTSGCSKSWISDHVAWKSMTYQNPLIRAFTEGTESHIHWVFPLNWTKSCLIVRSIEYEW